MIPAQAIVAKLSKSADLEPKTEAFLKTLRRGVHVYKYLFSWQTQSYIEGRPVRLEARDHSIECSACFQLRVFTKVGAPTVAVLGRRLRKISSINNPLSYFKAIALLMGFRVVDLTAPHLDGQISFDASIARVFRSRYMSLASVTGNYSCWINSMLEAEVLILTGNAGGCFHSPPSASKCFYCWQRRMGRQCPIWVVRALHA